MQPGQSCHTTASQPPNTMPMREHHLSFDPTRREEILLCLTKPEAPLLWRPLEILEQAFWDPASPGHRSDDNRTICHLTWMHCLGASQQPRARFSLLCPTHIHAPGCKKCFVDSWAFAGVLCLILSSKGPSWRPLNAQPMNGSTVRWR